MEDHYFCDTVFSQIRGKLKVPKDLNAILSAELRLAGTNILDSSGDQGRGINWTFLEI